MSAQRFRNIICLAAGWLCLLCATDVNGLVCKSGATTTGLNPQEFPNAGSESQLSIQSRFRFSWGGGTAKRWIGAVRFSGAKIDKPAILGFGTDSAGVMSFDDQKVLVRQLATSSFEGFDIEVAGEPEDKISVSFHTEENDQAVVREFLLSELIAVDQVFSLDQQNNRFSIVRAPGDLIQFKTPRKHLIFEPGEPFSFLFRANRLPAIQHKPTCLVEVFKARTSSEPLLSKRVELEIDNSKSTEFLEHSIQVPDAEGVYNLKFTIGQNTGSPILRTRRQAISREVQFVVVERQLRQHTPREYNELVLEIDPANLKPATPNHLNQFTRLIGLRTDQQTVGTFDIAPSSSTVELPVGGWQAIPLEFAFSNEQHVIEIEYSSGEPMSLGFSVLQPNETGQIPNFGFDSGLHVPYSIVDLEGKEDTKTHTHRFAFWPNTEKTALLIANRSQKQLGHFQKIRIFKNKTSSAKSLVTETHVIDATVGRRLMSFYEQPLFSENFEVRGIQDLALGQSVHDWVTFYEGTVRLAQYLQDSGAGGAFINVFGEGSSLMPLTTTQPTSRFDNGIFSTHGHDPIRKDVVELIYRIFEREGLQFIPVVSFDSHLAELEFTDDPKQDESIAITDFRNKPLAPGGTNRIPVYNPLSPTVQEVATNIIREVADRYRSRESYQGVAIICRPDTYSLLPGSQLAGYDPQTLSRFSEFIKTVNPEAMGEDLFPAANLALWIKWRNEQMTNWYRELGAVVSKESKQSRLYLALIDAFRNQEVASLLSPSLHRTADIADAMQRLGLNSDVSQGSDAIVLMRPSRLAPIHALASKKSEFSAENSRRLDEWFGGTAYQANLISHRSSWARFEKLEDSPFFSDQTSPILRLQQLNPAGIWNRERFARSLLSSDTRLLVDGGLLLNTNLDREVKRFMEIFSSLPDVSFDSVVHIDNRDEVHPIAVRYLQRNGNTFLYCVNGSPWEISATIKLSGSIPADVEPLSGSNAMVPSSDVDGQFQFRLAPFELMAVKLKSSNIEFEHFAYRLPETAQRDLNTSYYKLRSRLVASGKAEPVELLSDPSFETRDAHLAWTTGDQQTGFARFDRRDAHDGNVSLLLDNRNKNTAWIRSNEFLPPATGRVSVSVWLKTRDDKQQPPLRISIESSDPASSYYRFAEVGSLMTDQKQNQLSTHWKRFAVHFDDLPQERISGLRVGFDMMEAGNVWIDHVQVYDRWMDENDLKAMTQRFASIGPLMQKQEKMERCRQILSGYWPTFLREYFDENVEQTNISSTSGTRPQQSYPRSSMRKRFRRFVSPGIFQFR